MKPTTSHLNHWKMAAIAGLLFTVSHFAQAEDLTYTLKRDLRFGAQPAQAEGRRLPAIRRIELGFTPYLHEGRSGSFHRHDEITSHVLAVHLRRVAGEMALFPGHSLAPDLARIVSR